MNDSKIVSYWTLVKYTWQLSKTINMKNVDDAKLGRMRKCFNDGNYSQVLAKLLGSLNLKTRIHFDFMQDNFILDEMKKHPNYDFALKLAIWSGSSFSDFGYREPAHVLIDRDLPHFGSKEFENYITRMKMGESMKLESFESFVMMLVHELMHVNLFSRRHQLCRSEIATDIAVLLSGYAEIAKIGIAGRGGRVGYLSFRQFNFVYVLVKMIKFFKRK